MILLRPVLFLVAIAMIVCAATVRGAIISETTHAHGTFASPGTVVQGILNDDLLEQPGVVGSESSTTGWHNVTPAEPGRFIQLTDGAGPADPLYGIVNDFSPAPVNTFTYALASRSDLQSIRVIGGNYNNGLEGDGRIFLTVLIEASTDGAIYTGVGGANGTGYYQSDPSGAINAAGNPGNISGEFLNSFEETLLTIRDDVSTTLLSGVTHLRVSIFDADNTQGQNRDPYDGVNPHTGVDDGLTAAIAGPLLWEIDVVGAPSTGLMPDLNMDGVVDIFDVNIVSDNWGNTGAPGIAGDANKDGTVDIFDVNVISDNWTHSGDAAVVPEPSTLGLIAVASLITMGAATRRRRMI